MILENNKEISQAALSKLIEETLKKFPQFKKDGMVMLKYAPHLYQVAPYSEPPRTTCPRNIPLPLLSIVETENGSKSYRYAVTAVKNADGVTYRPANLNVTQQIPITDIELLVYLYNFCPWVKECKNKVKGIEHTLEIEDTRRDAISKTEKSKIDKKYLELLFDTKIELLKSIASSYNLTIDEDEDDANIVQSKILAYIGENEAKKVSFIETIENTDALKDTFSALDKLKDAQKLGIIAYEPIKKQWDMIPVGGEAVKLYAQKKPDINGLYQQLIKTNEETLQAIIKEVDARQASQE
jgi:hypothetical protein